LLRSHLAAAGGDLERARALLRVERGGPVAPGSLTEQWAAALGPVPWAAEGERDAIGAAAAWLERGDPLAALRRVEAQAEGLHPVLRIHALVVEAAARHGLGQSDAAAEAVERALALAEPDGFRRPFTSGAVMGRLLERELARSTPYGPFVSELLDAHDRRSGGTAREPVDALSVRERAVLRLLPTLLSYPEIAGELFVSVNTVKTHVKSIYRKLEVTSRREAVARGRALRLL
jgi:LuxR family maltose regulon positive regulatory protein